ncbi:MAG: hypothetical protein HYT94_02145 [Parcubacteria group bacterium]|nr:hypothetical protein [Parcubacteria group bacterium]
MLFQGKDYTIHVILIIGFLLTVILQIALMVKQYELAKRVVPQTDLREERIMPMKDVNDYCDEGMRMHFNENSGEYDGCVPMDYVGV